MYIFVKADIFVTILRLLVKFRNDRIVCQQYNLLIGIGSSGRIGIRLIMSANIGILCVVVRYEYLQAFMAHTEALNSKGFSFCLGHFLCYFVILQSFYICCLSNDLRQLLLLSKEGEVALFEHY